MYNNYKLNTKTSTTWAGQCRLHLFSLWFRPRSQMPGARLVLEIWLDFVAPKIGARDFAAPKIGARDFAAPKIGARDFAAPKIGARDFAAPKSVLEILQHQKSVLEILQHQKSVLEISQHQKSVLEIWHRSNAWCGPGTKNRCWNFSKFDRLERNNWEKLIDKTIYSAKFFLQRGHLALSTAINRKRQSLQSKCCLWHGRKHRLSVGSEQEQQMKAFLRDFRGFFAVIGLRLI